ncbi:AMP-binding protein, partial [uncultured Ruminobacter sp.]|uniref:AMP-binding protein n=1 Tax=uncultured Ruminobacter sp. TaxID=538947 RepID=UPI0025D21963
EPDLSSLKVLQVGGARLDPQDAVVIQKRFGCRLQQVFGTAEGLICCTRLDDSDDAVVNSQGKPISPYDNCVIVDDNDRPLPQGEIGELLVKGPYTIHEYYRAGEKNLTAFNAEGYYRMGDLVRMRDDGNFEVRGRIKEQINRAGEKIAAAEVETLLLEHPCIESCAVVPVKDEVLGERICAFAIGEEMNLSEVRDYLREKGLALFKLPDQLVFIDSWPLTAVGKIDKKRLSVMGGEAA